MSRQKRSKSFLTDEFEQFKDIEKFFETMPKLIHTIEVINPKTKVKSPIVLEGLNSFFIGMVYMSLEAYFKLNFAS